MKYNYYLHNINIYIEKKDMNKKGKKEVNNKCS